MLTGIAVGGMLPLIYSLLGDLCPVSQRAAMAALTQMAMGAGVTGGQVRDIAGADKLARARDHPAVRNRLLSRPT